MKLLILTPFIPWPLSEGGKISQFAVIDALRKQCTVVLVLAVYSEQDDENINALQQHWPDVDIRKITLFKPGSKPGFKQRLKAWLKKIVAVVSPSQPATDSGMKIMRDTDSPYLQTLFNVKNREFVEAVAAVIAEVKPGIVQVDILNYIDLALLVPAGIKKVFVHHELRFVRLESYLDSAKESKTAYDDFIVTMIKKQEVQFLNLYDGIFVFSEADKSKLVNLGVETNIFSAPFPVLDEYFMPVTQENARINKLVFVGGDNHSPNIDAVEWYVNEIAGEINKVKKMVLYVIGKWSDRNMARYINNSHVHFTGYVKDLREYCRHSAMLVPVRIGSGIRTKILYAMAQGVPVISTSIGSEGIVVNDKESILIANTPAAFAEVFKVIVANEPYTAELVKSAQEIIKKYYSQEYTVALRMKYLTQVLNN